MLAYHQALTKQDSINDDRHYSRLCKSFDLVMSFIDFISLGGKGWIYVILASTL